MEWTEDTITRLRELWAEGLSTAKIGRRLGVSKNAIVGKAHRLDLPARPSPIRREGAASPAPRTPSVKRPDGPTLPPLASTEGAILPPTIVAAAPHPVSPPAPVATVASVVSTAEVTGHGVLADAPPRRQALATVRMASPPIRPYARVITCCWPIGEPGTHDFRFCDAASEPGKPYCADHAKLAYVKVRDRREDAA